MKRRRSLLRKFNRDDLTRGPTGPRYRQPAAVHIDHPNNAATLAAFKAAAVVHDIFKSFHAVEVTTPGLDVSAVDVMLDLTRRPT